MKRILIVIGSSAIALLSYVCFFASRGTNVTVQPLLRGRVTDLETRDPVIGVNIECFKARRLLNTGTTDIDGMFSLPEVEEHVIRSPGYPQWALTVHAKKEGYYLGVVEIMFSPNTLDAFPNSSPIEPVIIRLEKIEEIKGVRPNSVRHGGCSDLYNAEFAAMSRGGFFATAKENLATRLCR